MEKTKLELDSFTGVLLCSVLAVKPTAKLWLTVFAHYDGVVVTSFRVDFEECGQPYRPTEICDRLIDAITLYNNAEKECANDEK